MFQIVTDLVGGFISLLLEALGVAAIAAIFLIFIYVTWDVYVHRN